MDRHRTESFRQFVLCSTLVHAPRCGQVTSETAVRPCAVRIQIDSSFEFPACTNKVPLVEELYSSHRHVSIGQVRIERQSLFRRSSSQWHSLVRRQQESLISIFQIEVSSRERRIFGDGVLEE